MKNKHYLRFIWALLCPYKYKLILICFIMFLLSGGNMVIPLLQQQIIDGGIISGNWKMLIVLLVLMGSCYIIISLLSYCIYRIQANIDYALSINLQTESMKHLVRLKKKYFDNEGAIKLSKDADYCVETLMRVADSSISQLLIELFKFVGIMIAMFLISWKLALLILSFIPIRFIFNLIIGLKIGKNSSQNLSLHQNLHKWEDDVYSTMTEIKLWNLHEQKDKEYNGIISSIRDVIRKINTLNAADAQLGEAASQIVFCLIYLFAAQMIGNSTLSIGGLLVLVSYFSYILTPVALVASLNNVFSSLKPAIDRYEIYMAMEEENIDDRKDIDYKNSENISDIKESFIQLDKISFSYGTRKILDDISLQIAKGEKVALVGDNGAGKSTLVDLILRFKDPSDGIIMVNGRNIENYCLYNYREMFGVVTQSPNLFDTTVINNVTLFGKLEINKQIINLPLFNFIPTLPSGIKSEVGNKSAKLSGGEKQKIAFCRALMKKASIMILDEPTSNYDKDSKEDFFSMLSELDCTAIIISHDNDLLQKMSRIILLNQGELHIFSDFESYAQSEYYKLIKEEDC